MMRKVAAGAALVVVALALGSAAGARHAVSDLPTVTVEASESVAVSDDPISAPPADATVDEAVTAADEVGVFPPAQAIATEGVAIVDDVGVALGVVVSVNEAVSVDDSVVVLPAVVVNVSEAVDVSDDVAAIPPVAARVDEAVRATDTIEVALNSAPIASAGGPYSIDEGGSVQLLGSGVDPEGGPLTFLWSPSTRLNDASSAQPIYSGPDDAAETLTLAVKDTNGLTGSAHALVTVRNVAPVLTAGGEAQLPAGSSLLRAVSFTDPGADTWRGTADFGDGTAPQLLLVPSRSFILAHAYTLPGVYTVHVSVSDDDAGTGVASFVVRVLNTAPQVSAGSDVTLNEGANLTRTGTITDTPDTWTGTVDYGDGGGPRPLSVSGNSISLSHVYRDNGDYGVQVSVSDSHGATGTAGFVAHVRNVAPTVGTIAGVSAGAVRVRTPVTLHAAFTDPGSLDTHVSTWRWGDGSTSAGVVAAGTSSATHAYSAPGVYSVTVSVTDDDGGTGDSAAATVLVYNPQAGSVVGVGKLAGPGVFALAVRNESGATRGVVDFSTGRGGLAFQSDSFDWLLTTHGCALTTGRGRVDGRTGFSFWVTAVHADGPDRFRIRIWRTATGVALIDTGSGPLSDCATPDRLAAGVIAVGGS